MPLINDPALCKRIIELCRDADGHFVGHWKSGHREAQVGYFDTVRKPGTNNFFQYEEAWEFIAECLEAGYVLHEANWILQVVTWVTSY